MSPYREPSYIPPRKPIPPDWGPRVGCLVAIIMYGYLASILLWQLMYGE